MTVLRTLISGSEQASVAIGVPNSHTAEQLIVSAGRGVNLGAVRSATITTLEHVNVMPLVSVTTKVIWLKPNGSLVPGAGFWTIDLTAEGSLVLISPR